MTIWVTSDTHFGHANILTFVGLDGQRLRPEWDDVEAMDEALVDRWNAVVKPSDHVYHLGDVVIPRRSLAIVARLRGHKRLVRGNHDIYRTKAYLEAGFEEIHGMRVLANTVLTHCPIHPGSLGRFRGNIHGHIHERPSPPGAYLNVSVERTSYTPITLEQAVSQLSEATS